jgi:hypothetical protein
MVKAAVLGVPPAPLGFVPTEAAEGRGEWEETHPEVREEGLEPSRPFGHRNLNPARLPIPPLARVESEG